MLQKNVREGVGRRRARWATVAIACLAATTLAACGGDDASDASGGSTTSASADGAGLATAKEGHAAAIKEPTTFEGPTDPVEGKRGFKIGVLACDVKLSGCTKAPQTMLDVAKKELGASGRLYDGQSDPQKWNAALLQMVADKVDVIGMSGITPQLASQGLDAAEKAGIPVINSAAAGSTPNPPADNPGVFAGVDIDLRAAGRATADFVTVDSGGKAHVAVLVDKSQIGVSTHVDEFKKHLKEVCPDCKQTDISTSLADVTTKTPSQVVGKLRSDPSIDRIYIGYDPQAAFIVPALQQAGMEDKVKIHGILGNPQNIEFIRDGTVQVSDIVIDETYYGWAMLDQGLRGMAGKDAAEPQGQNTPWFLVTKADDNLPPAGTAWVAPSGYEDAYRKLWGIS